MGRVTRRVATITLVINASSDENMFKGAGYVGGQTSAELETTLRAWVNEWFENQFPREHKKSILEFGSVSVSIT